MKKMNVHRVLAPVDFSNNSLKAVQVAVAVAKRHDAILHLLYIDDHDYSLFEQNLSPKVPRFPEIMKMLTQISKTVINNEDVKCTYSTETGSVTHCILKTAAELNADLIIMGKNGNNSPCVEYAGTHAYQISEKSPIPVILVPPGISQYNFNNILFPIRPYLSVPGKYDAIRGFILKCKPRVTLFNMRHPEDEIELHIVHRLSFIMKKKLERDKVPYVIKYHFKDGKFAESIMAMQKEADTKFDLIVITKEAEELDNNFDISYYAQKLIHGCEIPILIIKPDVIKLNSAAVLGELDSELIN